MSLAQFLSTVIPEAYLPLFSAYLFPIVVAAGIFTLAKFSLKTIGVLLQTFVLPGKSVRRLVSSLEV